MKLTNEIVFAFEHLTFSESEKTQHFTVSTSDKDLNHLHDNKMHKHDIYFN